MTTANKITIVRLLLIPVFVLLGVYYGASVDRHEPEPDLQYAAILVFLVASISDGLDGYIARHYNQRSKLGAVLDPIADKGLLLAGIFTLSFTNWGYKFPLWFPVLVVSRDVIVVAGSLGLHYLNGEVHVRPRWSGKIATVFQMVAIVWAMLQLRFIDPAHSRRRRRRLHADLLGAIHALTASANSATPPTKPLRPRKPMKISTPPLPVVAIVGRPNVGKSALFNRLAGRQISIVHDQPGITRDRLVAECKLARGLPFEIIDTGGIGMDVDGSFSARVHAEAEIALTTADAILFVVDGRAGFTPVDQDLAKRLRRSDKPVILVVNKIDEDMHTPLEAEFTRLGFKQVVGVSAAHGRGISEMVAAVTDHLERPPEPAEDADADGTDEPAPDATPRIPMLALVGRPNVGKSSLTNAILGQERTIVSDVSGTTRDAVDIRCRYDGKDYVLIDTAGIRQPRQARQFSGDFQRHALGVEHQARGSLRAGHRRERRHHRAGSPDCQSRPAGPTSLASSPSTNGTCSRRRTTRARASAEYREEWLAAAQAELFFMSHAPFVAISALHGRTGGSSVQDHRGMPPRR